MKKLMSILLILSFGLFTFSTLKAETSGRQIGHAIISVDEDLPVFFVKGNEDLQGDKALEVFKLYFSIRDQRQDVEVENEYLDLGTFDIDVVGTYDIIIRFTGESTLEVSEQVTVYVIEADTLAPVVYGFRENIVYNVSKKSKDDDQKTSEELAQEAEERINKFIASLNLTVRDNVDGLIPLTKEHFTGVDEIDSTNLNGEYEITLTVRDNANNVLTKTASVVIKDVTGPVIYNPHNISTRRNKPVEFKDHIHIEDNFNEREDIEVWYTIAYLTYEMVDGEQQTVLTEVEDIDFSKLGEYVITVHAKDKSDNLAATKQYKVIIEDGIKLSTVIILANLGLLVIAGVGVISLVLIHKSKKKGEHDETL